MGITPRFDNDAQQVPGAELAAVPGRRSVLRAAAWSVPAVSLAAAAPAFATSPGATPAVTFSSVMFWRPKGSEIPEGEGGYWVFIPEESVLWVTTVTNTTAKAVNNVALDLGVPAGGTQTEFTVLDASDLPVAPVKMKKSNRPASGRLVVTLPELPALKTAAVTVALLRPSSVPRLSAASWPLTVSPPATGTTTNVKIVTYAEIRAAVK